MKKLLIAAACMLSVINLSHAHCPLCTIGAAAAAGGAAYLGVGHSVIGLFLGAFAVSMGMWFSRVMKRQVIPLQDYAIVSVSFITTIVPLNPLFQDFHPLFISFLGDYGTTYALDLFLICAFLGGMVTMSTPWLSAKITEFRGGKLIPYQGISLTLGLLLICGLVLQLLA